MIDKDGIERPEAADSHENNAFKNQKRKVQFDETYPFRPRNIFFRAWSAFFRGLAICILNPYMVFRRHMRSFGADKKFMQKGKFVMTCNHVSFLDDVSIGTNLFAWRKIYYTTLDANIRRPCIGFFLRSLGGIPIPIESLQGMKKFNQDVSNIIQSGKPVLYNPEGSLWNYYREIRPFKKGAFSMAIKNDVPVLPIVLLFKRKKKRNGKFRYRFYFAICQPAYADKSLDSLHAQVEELTNRVHATYERVAKEWYEIQDCGFGNEGSTRKLRCRDLKLVNDQWVVKKK